VGETLREVELFRVRLPLVAPFRTAKVTTAVKEALLVRVLTTAGVGWGECTALVTPGYDGETIDDARLALRDHLVPRAFAGAQLDDVRGHTSARAALECALLDARLRAEGTSLAAWLGAERATIDAGVAVGLVDDVAALRRSVAAYVEAGYRRIKCKIEPGHDVEVLAAARAEAGPEVALAADANGSYSLDEATRLFEAIENADLALQCVEQPCAPEALAEHATLIAQVNTPVCLDETITSAAVANDAIARRACDALAVKVGRLGIDEAKRVHDACVRATIDALPGGMLETGVGRAALLAVAALPGFTLAGDCSASERFFGIDGDLTEPFVIDDGKLRVPSGAGLGVEPIPERLARCTVARERLSARG
jgi:O-succinylbenzoate synthase